MILSYKHLGMILSDIHLGMNLSDFVSPIYTYEGRSICNENSPVNPKVLYLRTS